MKFNSKVFSFFGFVLLISSVIWVGCQTQTPTSTSVAQSAVDQFALVNITSSGVPATAPHITGVTMGTHLFGNPSGGIIEAVSYSLPITVCGGPTPFQLVPSGFSNYNETYQVPPSSVIYNGGCPVTLATVGWNNSVVPTGLTDSYDQYGLNIIGYINDPENPNYPPGPDNIDNVTLEILPVGGGPYDVTPYHGIQFYINVAATDNVVDRQFLVNVEQQLPSGGGITGNCLTYPDPQLTHCYDGFAYDFENIPKNQWVLVQKNWGDLKQWGFGSVTSPPTLSGANLKQVAVFEWVEENAASAGPMTINYTLAGIRFY